MGIIHHHPGAIGLGQFDDGRKIRDIALHAEDAVDDDQFPLVFGLLEDPFQILHVVVAIFLHLSEGEAAAVNDAGMIVFVDDGHIISTQQGGDGSQIGLIAGGKDEGRFLSEETGQFRLPVLRGFPDSR